MNYQIDNLEPIREDLEDQFEEEKLISKAEKRFDELSNLFTFVPPGNLTLFNLNQSSIRKIETDAKWQGLIDSKSEYEHLRRLLIERAHLKITSFYEDALSHIYQLARECRKMQVEQYSLLENYRLGYIGKFKPDDTFFDEFASVGATLKMHTTHWVQTKQMILTNRWYYDRLDQYLNGFVSNLRKFYRSCVEMCRFLETLIDNGIFILCRVSEEAWLDASLDEYGRDFFLTFDHLNGVRRHLKELRKSTAIDSRRSAKTSITDWTLEKLFDKLSLEDGKYLAQRAAKEFGSQLAHVGFLCKSNSTEVEPTLVDRVKTNSNLPLDSDAAPWILDLKMPMESLLNFGETYLTCNSFVKSSNKASGNSTEKSVLVHDATVTVRKNQNNKSVDTSDYYSSSASSSKTITEAENPISIIDSQTSNVDSDHLSKKKLPSLLNKRTKRSLQNFYSNFLEHRYTTFNLLLEEGSRHKSLHTPESASLVIERPQTVLTSAKKSVKWLDDTLKKNKKHMWKKYVETLWSSFLEEWELILTHGRCEFASVRATKLVLGKQMATAVLDSLLMVQLPKELSPCDALVHKLRQCFQEVTVDCDFRNLLLECANSKSRAVIDVKRCTAENVLNNVEVDIERIHKIAYLSENASYCILLNYVVLWQSLSQAVSGMSSFDLVNGYAVVRKYSTYFGDRDLLRKTQLFFENSFKLKVGTWTSDVLKVVFPTNKFWRLHHRGDSSEDAYLESLQSMILDPAVDAAKCLSTANRSNFLITVLEEMIRSWIQWIQDKDIRFSPTGATLLRRDFDFVLDSVRSLDWLSTADKEQISNLGIFRRAVSITDFLEGKALNNKERYGSATFSKRQRWRNFKVTPIKSSEERSQEETSNGKDGRVVLEASDLEMWSKYRTRSLLPNCSCLS